jgi:ribonucleotide monophosphatase NagD (HAD superfamily)
MRTLTSSTLKAVLIDVDGVLVLGNEPDGTRSP